MFEFPIPMAKYVKWVKGTLMVFEEGKCAKLDTFDSEKPAKFSIFGSAANQMYNKFVDGIDNRLW